MVATTFVPQGLHSALADMNLPTRLHPVASGDNGDTGGIHWVGLAILLLKLLPFVLAIAGIIYRATRRGASTTSSTYAPNRPVAAPWQPAAIQTGGGYTPHSRPVAPWQPAASIAPPKLQSPPGTPWHPAAAYPAASVLAASAPASYTPAHYR